MAVLRLIRLASSLCPNPRLRPDWVGFCREECRPSLPSHSLASARSARAGTGHDVEEICQKNLDSIIEGALPPQTPPMDLGATLSKS